MYVASRRDAQMGALPVAAIGGAISAIGGLFGGGNPKDPGRLAANERAYAAAMGGDAVALDFLKYRSGKYGISPSRNWGALADKNPTTVGGWATDKAKKDALSKYQSAVLATDPTGGRGPVTSQTGTTLPVPDVGRALGGMGVGVAAVAAVAAIMLLRNRR